MSVDASQLVAIMGTTASGKTRLAEGLADRTGYRLINADAFQVYRWLDIGTAKSERREDYLLMDLVYPWESFGAGEWLARLIPELEELFAAGRGGIVVGGTLYYIRALFEEFSQMHGAPAQGLREALNDRSLESLLEELRQRAPNEAAKVDPRNRVRVQRALERLDSKPLAFKLPPFRRIKLGLDPDPRVVSDRIGARVADMLAAGWLDEVASLRERGVDREDPGMRAHGYRALWDVAQGRRSLQVVEPEIATEVTQYAKRQRTWMRREPNLVKLPLEDEGKTLAAALDVLWGGV